VISTDAWPGPASERAQFADGQLVRRDVLVVAERGDEDVEEILAAEKVVARAGVHFDDAVEQLQDGHVEGAAAQVEHREARAVALFLQSIGQRRRRGLVDQAFHADAGQLARGARGLALRVGEIRRYADHRLGDLLAGGRFGVGDERAQDQCGQFLRTERARAQPGFARRAHPALECRHTVAGMAHHAVAGGLADDDVAFVVNAHHRGRQQVAQRVREQSRTTRAELADERMRRPQIDTHDHP
jgi:hypothetical protein